MQRLEVPFCLEHIPDRMQECVELMRRVIELKPEWPLFVLSTSLSKRSINILIVYLGHFICFFFLRKYCYIIIGD